MTNTEKTPMIVCDNLVKIYQVVAHDHGSVFSIRHTVYPNLIAWKIFIRRSETSRITSVMPNNTANMP